MVIATVRMRAYLSTYPTGCLTCRRTVPEATCGVRRIGSRVDCEEEQFHRLATVHDSATRVVT